jgi:hypothetical protein
MHKVEQNQRWTIMDKKNRAVIYNLLTFAMRAIRLTMEGRADPEGNPIELWEPKSDF